jgi:protocadherin Fat 1/2/3
VNTSVDYETQDLYNLTVRVSSNSGSATTFVIVNIVDVNEPPSFLTQYLSVNVNESSPTGTTIVGSLTSITSEDDTTETLEYSIVSGNTDSKFAIDNTTGRVTLSSALDYNTLSTYVLKVRVQDKEGLYDTLSVTVYVLNVNEAPTISSVEGTFASVDKGAANGTVVGYIYSWDSDTTQTKYLNYSIVAGNTDHALGIKTNATSWYAVGVLYVRSSIALSASPSLNITVRVTDSGSPALSAEATYKIAIVSVSTGPSLSDQSFTIFENATSGSGVGQALSTLTSDDDSSTTFTFAIVSYGDDRYASIT